jgi:hypothetical protein
VLRWVADRLYSAQAQRREAGVWDRLLARLQARVDLAGRYTVAYMALASGGNGADDEIARLCEEARWREIGLITEVLAINNPREEKREISRDRLVQLLAQQLASRSGAWMSSWRLPRRG